MPLLRSLTQGVVIMLIAALVSVGLQAAEPRHSDHYGNDYRTAYQTYLTATEGDRSATREALKTFTELHEANPEDPVALMLMGASQTLRGRDAWMPWNKMSYTEDGLDQLEQAQTLLASIHDDFWFEGLPVSLLVPAMAGITYVQVPSMFGRFEQGLQLLESVLDHPQRQSAWAPAMTSIYRYTVEAALEVEDRTLAEEAMSALEQLGIDDTQTQKARSLMEEG